MNLAIKIRKDNIWLKIAAYFYVIIVITFEYDMSTFNKVINAVASIFLVFVAMVSLALNRKYRKINIVSGYIALQIVFLIYALVSSLWAFSFTQSLSIFKLLMMTILAQLALVILCSYYSDGKYSIINLILIVMVGVMCRTLIVTPVGAYGHVRLFIRYSGYNKNIFGMMYAMGSFLALYMYDKSNKKRYYVCCLMFVIMAMLAQSRKSVLMVFMFIPLYIVLKSSKWKKIRNIVLICSLIIVFAYVVTENEALYEIVGKRIINLFLSLAGSTNYTDGSITERAMMRRVAEQLTIQKPILGWGANYFASYFKSYSIWGRYAYCHCNYLELLVSYGIVGAVLYYLPYAFIISKNIGGIKNHNRDAIFNIVFFSVLFVMEYGFVSYYEPLFGLFKLLAVLLLDSSVRVIAYRKDDNEKRTIGA